MKSSISTKAGIRKRLIWGFAITPMIMIALSYIGVSKVNAVNDSLSIINDTNSVKQRYAINFRGSVHDRAISLRDVVLYSQADKIEQSLDEIKSLAKFYEESAVALDKIFSELAPSREESKFLQDIKEIEIQTLPIAERVVKAKLSGNNELAWTILMVEAKPAFSTWLARINKFIDHQENLNQIESKEARAIASGYQKLMILLTLFSVVIAALLGFYTIQVIVRSLRMVAGDIDVSSKTIQSVSEDISESSKTLADGSRSQAGAIQSIGTALEQMNAMIQKSADNAQNAASLAVEGKNKAVEGEAVVEKMIQAMDDIQISNQNITARFEESNNQISEIVAVISEIGNKTNVINEIVFQTKLLSFNASVEAARAGESGKGFAVVAEEVGSLAQLSGGAAKEISDLLSVSRRKVEQIVAETKTRVGAEMENAQVKVTAGNEIAKKCAESLGEIAKRINEVTRMAAEISSATKEQSIGFQQVTRNVGEMDRVTRTNSKVASETAETLQSLNLQAQEMRKAYQDLSKLVGLENEHVATEMDTRHSLKSVGSDKGKLAA